MDPALLEAEAAMLGLQCADTAQVRAAEQSIKAGLARPGGGLQLLQLLQLSGHEPVRQLCCVLLRPRIVALWNRAKGRDKDAVKAALLSRLASESSRSVRKSLISVIAALAKALAPGGNWPDLFGMVQQTVREPAAEVRELGLVLVGELTESLGVRMSEFVPAVLPVLARGLEDGGAPSVRAAALRSTCGLLAVLETRKAQAPLAGLLPRVLTVLEECLASDEVAAIGAMDALSDLVEAEAAVLVPHVGPLVVLAVRVLSGALPSSHGGLLLEDSTRASGAQLLMELIQFRPKLVVSGGHIPSILQACLGVVVAYDPEAEREAEARAREAGVAAADFDDDSLWNVALRVIDTLARCAPSRVVFSALSGATPALLGSPDWRHRRAGLMLIATAAEGCAEEYLPALEGVLGTVLPLGADPQGPVREGVCWVLTQLSEHCTPRILRFHASVLPAVFSLLDDASPFVLERACQVVEGFLDGLGGEEVAPYLPGFMGKLGGVLTRPSQATSVQETVVAALTSTAIAAGPLMRPYLPTLAPALLAMLSISDARLFALRARATECMGHVALAVGREAFAPWLDASLAAVGEGWQLCSGGEGGELAENGFAFFSCMARLLGADLGPAVPALVDRIADCLASSEGLEEEEEEGGEDAAAAVRFADAGGEDEEDEEEGGGQVSFRVRTSLMDVKVAAVNCLCALAAHCGPCLAPFLPQAMGLLEVAADYFHDEVREQATLGCEALLACSLAANPPIPPLAPGFPALLQAPTTALLQRVAMLLLGKLSSEPSESVAAHACVGLQRVAARTGAAGLEAHAPALLAALLRILNGRAPCQAAGGGGQEEEEEDGGAGRGRGAAAESEEDEEGGDEEAEAEEEEHNDRVLLDEAVDATVAIARALGRDAFLPHLPALVAAMRRFSRPGSRLVDRVMGAGWYGDMADAVGGGMDPYVASDVVPALLGALPHGSADLRRNACFCVGTLAAHCPEAVRPSLPALLRELGPTLQRRGGAEAGYWTHGGLVAPGGGPGGPDSLLPRTPAQTEEDIAGDNALSALCRVSTAAPGALPLPQALAALLPGLPIRSDRAEDAPVLTFLLEALWQRPQGVPLPQLARCLLLCADAATARSRVDVATKEGLLAPGLRRLSATLSPEERATLVVEVEAQMQAGGWRAGGRSPAVVEELEGVLRGVLLRR